MTSSSSSSRPTLYSIGHSKHSERKFLDLLVQQGIKVLADVRSHPYSRFNPHFNRTKLTDSLKVAGISYVFLGDELGGRPKDKEFRDEAGHALYHRMALSPMFQQGIERLELELADRRVAMMCSEENPAICHRHLLIARVMTGRGIHVIHIRGDGRLETEDQIGPQDKQSLLFAAPEQSSWKSLQSSSPKRSQVF